MLVLSAILIENQLKELREQALKIGQQMGVKCPLSVLPMHVSLKKGIDINQEDLDSCVDAICAIYSKIEPFSVEVEGLELSGGIVWLRLKENQKLTDLHSALVELGKTQFGSQPDEMDLDFKYHSTLFMDSEKDLSSAFEALRKVKLPQKITVRNFLIGTSDNGKPEGYSVYKHFSLGPDISVKEQWERFESK
ncbi:MAG: 2'-5' RNA ligase family protein [Spirochaetales bacterium]|nr:2'-5' RNA ligase family protein [Spirochaetales bacterium]MBO7349410.1 2'-5' RNA ligase family protein [Spirochaetales bacterium]MBP5756981.1 2'-5' RNA ligase family protein [Spirochaetales bacterium]